MTKELLKVSEKQPVASGYSRSGNEWRRQTVVFETAPDYYGNVRKIAIDAMNDKVELMQSFPEGSWVEVGYIVSAREYNGRWFNDVRLVSATQPGGGSVQDDGDLPA